MTHLLAIGWFFLAFFACEALGYGFHWLLHTKWAGLLQHNHLVHHIDKYPPKDFTSQEYRLAGSASTLWPFLIAGLILAGLALWLTPLWFSLSLIFHLCLVGFLNNYLHEQIHLESSKLQKYVWFRVLRALHWQHHFKMKTNYGIFSFGTDKMAGTYREPTIKLLKKYGVEDLSRNNLPKDLD